MKQGLTIRKPVAILAREAGHTELPGPVELEAGDGDTVTQDRGRGRPRARPARPDRGALDRLDPRPRAARPDLAAGHAVVPGELPVLHDPDRLRRPRARPVAGLVDPGRRARHRVR